MIKILVDEKNILLLTHLAYFLDQPEFINKVEEIRRCWKIDNNFVKSDGFKKWYQDLHPDFSLTKEAADCYLNFLDKFEIEGSRNDQDIVEKTQSERKLAKLSPLDLETELLMKQFGINPKYKEITIKAIACNEITEEDVEDINGGVYEYDFILNDSKFSFVQERTYKGKRSKTEIFRDRKIHFMSVEDKISQNKIAKEERLTREAVKEALKRYRKFLQG